MSLVKQFVNIEIDTKMMIFIVMLYPKIELQSFSRSAEPVSRYDMLLLLPPPAFVDHQPLAIYLASTLDGCNLRFSFVFLFLSQGPGPYEK